MELTHEMVEAAQMLRDFYEGLHVPGLFKMRFNRRGKPGRYRHFVSFTPDLPERLQQYIDARAPAIGKLIEYVIVTEEQRGTPQEDLAERFMDQLDEIIELTVDTKGFTELCEEIIALGYMLKKDDVARKIYWEPELPPDLDERFVAALQGRPAKAATEDEVVELIGECRARGYEVNFDAAQVGGMTGTTFDTSNLPDDLAERFRLLANRGREN